MCPRCIPEGNERRTKPTGSMETRLLIDLYFQLLTERMRATGSGSDINLRRVGPQLPQPGASPDWRRTGNPRR